MYIHYKAVGSVSNGSAVAPLNTAPCSGFTLIELMVTLTVAIILVGLAVPAFSRITAQNHLATTANDFVSAFAMARQSAIQLGSPVALCAGDDSGCFASVDWSKGWVAFVDRDKDGALDQNERELYTGIARRHDVHVAGNRPMQMPVIFTPMGFALQPSGAFAAGTLRVCVTAPIEDNARNLVLSKVGRLRVERADYGGDCPAP